MILNAQECLYCGDLATDRDHVIPFSWTDKSVRTFTSAEVVPACKHCNISLHAKPFFTIAARAEHMARKLRGKKILQAPDWTEEDIAALGPTLQTYVRRQARLKHLTRTRLERCERVARMTTLIPAEYWDSAA